MRPDIAGSFGAKLSLKMADAAERQLFFVRATGLHVPLAGLVRGAGGRPLLQASGWLLAEMGYSAAMKLRGTPGISFLSGVSVDPKRLEWFLKAAGRSSTEPTRAAPAAEE